MLCGMAVRSEPGGLLACGHAQGQLPAQSHLPATFPVSRECVKVQTLACAGAQSR